MLAVRLSRSLGVRARLLWTTRMVWYWNMVDSLQVFDEILFANFIAEVRHPSLGFWQSVWMVQFVRTVLGPGFKSVSVVVDAG